MLNEKLDKKRTKTTIVKHAYPVLPLQAAILWCVAVMYVFGHILGGTLKGYAVQRHFWHIF